MVKYLPAMWKTRIWFLGWKDLLEEGVATHSSIFAWRIPMDRGARHTTVHGVTRVKDEWATKHRTTNTSSYMNFILQSFYFSIFFYTYKFFSIFPLTLVFIVNIMLSFVGSVIGSLLYVLSESMWISYKFVFLSFYLRNYCILIN